MRFVRRLLAVVMSFAAVFPPAPGRGAELEIVVSRETTFVTGPIGADGAVDFLAAIEEKAREGVTPENNAFVPVARAVGARIVDPPLREAYFRELGIDVPPEQGGLVDWDEFVPDHSDKRFSKQYWRSAEGPWTIAECPDVSEWLRRNDAALELIVEAANRPRLYIPLTGNELLGYRGRAGLSWLLKAARLLERRAMRRIAARDDAGAWSDLLACRRLGRLTAASPLVGHQSVGIALEMYAARGNAAFAHHAGLDADGFRGRRDELARLGPPRSGLAEAIDFASRLDFLDLFRRFAATDTESQLKDYRALLSVEEFVEGTDAARNALVEQAIRGPVDRNEGLRAANRWHDLLADAARKETPREQQAAFDAVKGRLDAAVRDPTGAVFGPPEKQAGGELSEAGRNARVVVAALLMSHPTADKLSAEARTHAGQRYDLTLAALAEYRVRHERYPDRLDLLVPDFLAALPADRYAEGPVRYRPLRGGRKARLYSVGRNGRDEDGRSGVNRQGLSGDDVAANLPPDP